MRVDDLIGFYTKCIAIVKCTLIPPRTNWTHFHLLARKPLRDTRLVKPMFAGKFRDFFNNVEIFRQIEHTNSKKAEIPS